jgi:predicted glycogen debranching enzyme
LERTLNIKLDSSVCRDFEKAIATEWLITNGLGGYASGTVSGANARKYHGLLVVAAKPPVQRYVVLSRVEDRVIVGDGAVEKEGEEAEGVADLSTNEFADLVHPQGYKRCVSFELAGPGGGPVWRYEIDGGGVVEKSITLVHGQDAVIVRYVLLPGSAGGAQKPVRLQVQPMLAGRDFHGTIQLYNRPWWTIVSGDKGEKGPIMLAAPECPVQLQISHNADKFHVNACWWYNFTFRVERASGYPDREDLWTPGFLEFTMRPGVPVGFIASTQGVPWEQQEMLVAATGARREKLAHAFDKVDAKDEFLSALSVAADQFVVYRTAGAAEEGKESGVGASVIAGYPWFEDWGRDAFISLCGLTLVTGRHDVARAVLATFADHMRRGLLPNRFPDKSFTPDYNTVDASLWFVHAAYQYWRYSGDVAFLTKYLYPKLCEVMEYYRDGTDFGIRMDANGLIRAGDGNHQPTWMDAKIGDWVITPRHGKPVEINALWYSNLRVMALVATQAKDEARSKAFAELAQHLDIGGGGVYERVYFNPRAECLYDVVGDNGTEDPSIRPNQLLAVALPFSPLTPARQKMVVKACQRYLLTPMGMRTLAPPPPPGSTAYQAHCAGDQRSRDIAYHQGTVWPWLMGPFITAYVKACVVGGDVARVRREARQFLEPLRGHLFAPAAGGLGSISEIADGDAPHTPRGCPAQAWSVGEVLRAYYEDVLGKAPRWPHEKKG